MQWRPSWQHAQSLHLLHQCPAAALPKSPLSRKSCCLRLAGAGGTLQRRRALCRPGGTLLAAGEACAAVPCCRPAWPFEVRQPYVSKGLLGALFRHPWKPHAACTAVPHLIKPHQMHHCHLQVSSPQPLVSPSSLLRHVSSTSQGAAAATSPGQPWPQDTMQALLAVILKARQ